MRHGRIFLSGLVLAALAACSGTGHVAANNKNSSSAGSGPPVPAWAPEDAATGVTTPELAELLRGYWGWRMQTSPTYATMLGIRRYDDRIPDNSAAGIERTRNEEGRWQAAAESLDPAAMRSEDDRITLELLVEELRGRTAGRICQMELWGIGPRQNPITEWNYLPEMHTISAPEDAAHLVARYRQIAASIDNDITSLRAGLKQGLVTNAESLRRVLEMVKGQLAKPAAEWPLVARVKVPEESRGAYAPYLDEIAVIAERNIRPALMRYAAFVEGELLPAGRTDDRVGLSALPGGAACYATRIRHFTGLEKSAEEIHQLGLDEIARINDEMRSLGKKLFGTDSLADTLKRLRSDPALYFATEDEVKAKAESRLAAAKAAIPQYFGRLPKADCVVSVIPDYEAPYTTVAYYRPSVPDGKKPGEYFINVYKPETRTRYEAAALAFHESIPGHHLQVAIAQELPAMPAFRKHLGLTAFIEGWALYTERLADEMGLYESDLDRMGMLSYDAWRASRLVVDTGIHAMGWSRERAIAFMLAHTALAPNNIDNEVDRYIVWPGQALGYKLGQLEIVALRKQAEAALGSAFRLPEFHDVVLTKGAVSLQVLRKQVEAWIRTKAGESHEEEQRQ